jgi:hypothetical protein
MTDEQSPVFRTADPMPPREGDTGAVERTADPAVE